MLQPIPTTDNPLAIFEMLACARVCVLYVCCSFSAVVSNFDKFSFLLPHLHAKKKERQRPVNARGIEKTFHQSMVILNTV